jgi:hypothetical protein
MTAFFWGAQAGWQQFAAACREHGAFGKLRQAGSLRSPEMTKSVI